MEFSKEIVTDIAENLDCGMICFLNIKTKEVHHFLDPDEMYYDVDDEMAREMEEIESKGSEYIRFEKLKSYEAFGVMEDFTATVEFPEIRKELTISLEKRGPFRQFKYVLATHDNLLQRWYDFKQKSYESHVLECIEMFSKGN